jgi:hypothetical protein
VANERVLGREQPSDGVDAGDLEGLVGLQPRKDAWQAAREHRLPGTGRAGEEEVVPAGRGQLERTPGALLPAHVGEVGVEELRPPVRGRLVGRRLALAAEVRRRLRQVPDRNRLDPGQSRLGRRLGGAEQALDPRPPRPFRRREHPADRTHATVEGELTDGRVDAEPVGRNLPRCTEHGERDREVEAGALLAQRGGSKVDGDPPRRKVELGRSDAAADAVLRLLAGAVGQPDDREGGDGRLDVCLHLDPAGLEANHGIRQRAREHAPMEAMLGLRVCAESVPIRGESAPAPTR